MLRGGRLLPGSSVLDVYVAVLPSCDCHVLDDFACVWSLTLRSSSTTTPRSDPRTIRLVPTPEPIVAVVFDMDGVLVDTEHLWDEVREELTEEWGGRYTPEAQQAMMGMSSHEWSRYLHEAVGLQEPPDVINAEVVRRMLARYETGLPIVPGAVDAVRRLAAEGFRLALASSSNRELIDAVLRELELTSLFEVTVSSEEVGRGKPAPDVYLEAARRLGVEPALRGRRGLRQRDPRGARGRDARDRVSESALSPIGGGAHDGGCDTRLTGRHRRRRYARVTEARERATCRSCGGTSLARILHWPAVPVNAALFPATAEEALSIPRASFLLVACETCGLVFNADHDDELVEYSPRCVETQACSPTSRAFTDALAREWVDRHELRGREIVEVGCGPDATFLRTMCALTGARGIGIDPACTPSSDAVVTLLAERLDAAHATLPGSALVCRHTLEHVADVAAFVGLLRGWAARHPHAPVLIEVPDAQRVFRDGAFWDVYYEHCSYFTKDEPRRNPRSRWTPCGADALGVRRPVPSRRRGAGRAAAARSSRPRDGGCCARLRLSGDRADRAFTRRPRGARGRRTGASLAGGGTALAVLALADVDDAIAGVVDGNPVKRGLYLPGTSRSILGPQDVSALEPRHVVVMNAVYVEEVGRSLVDAGVTADVRAFESLLDP